MDENKLDANVRRVPGNCCAGTLMPELAEIERIAGDPRIIDGIVTIIDKYAEIVNKNDLVAGNCCPGTCMPEITKLT